MASRPKPIRIGIIGLGRAGWGMHCKELTAYGRRSKYDIVAGCDVIAKRNAMLAEHFDVPTYKQAIDLIHDPNVELVDIATPSPDHVKTACAALKAGKLVFLEKPIALDYTEAKRIARAAEKSDGRIWFRHNRRFEPAFNHIRDILDKGILGDVFEVKLCRGGYSRRDDWQTIIECGGGQLLNWGPHVVDHALQLLGSPVKKQWSNLKRIAAVGDAEDHVHIILTGENERVVELKISGGCALGEPTYLISGTKGSLRNQGSKIELKYLNPRQKLKRRRAKKSTPPFGGFGSNENLKWVKKTIDVKPKPKVNTDSIWDFLFDTIRKGKPFPVTTEEALEVMRVITEARKGTPFQKK